MRNKATKKETRNKDRVALSNGCQYTQPYVSPDNWESPKASVRKSWYIRFTYYDPIRRPEGMKIKWEGMNGHNTLAARQAATRQLLADTIEDLKNGHNPVSRPLITWTVFYR